MGHHFITGGIRPSDGLMLHVQDHLRARSCWRRSGQHYARTAEAWLRNLDQSRDALMPILEETYGSEAGRWHQRWRVFFMAVAELFGTRSGEEWWVVHHLLEKPGE